ncbi:MAG: NADH-quinone oxidoreductase subunit D [Candidatus Tectimicrobiota bacterium]|nr:MAG: NADH-quinone oxidoreductase subunit D [Candidatus Tectomicrobia bacterium]
MVTQLVAGEYHLSYERQGDDLILQMGPQHPSTHGVLRLELVTDGELIKRITPHIGYLHRCFEKHAEAMTYPQVIPYVDRMDYVAAMSMELGYVLTVEKLMGLTDLPERLQYIRVIMAEFQRIASHLLAVGTYGLDTGAVTPFLWCFRDREKILDLFEWASGARLLYNYLWIGGVMQDLPPGFAEKAMEFLDYFEPRVKELNDLLSFNQIFIERTANIGVLPPDVAISYGVGGPNLRGSGVRWDLRKEEPYCIYDRFDFDVPVGTGEFGTLGAAWDRYMVRVREMLESIKILRQALDQLPGGDPNEAMPRRVRPPEGDAFMRTESPRGEIGFYIVSDGSEKPLRCKGRSPCFTAISAIDAIGRGGLIADAVAIVGSLDIVLGEIDR